MEIDFEGLLKDLKGKAEEILEDNQGLKDLIENSIKKIKENEVFRSILDDLKLSIDLLSDYNRGLYRDLSKNSILFLIGGFIYLVSPIDLIPDFLPGGFIDDAAVFLFVFKKIEIELEKYREWKSSSQSTNSNRNEDIFEEEIAEEDIFIDIN